jgi:hypothetical protein
MSDPHLVYSPTYSNLGRISNRAPQIDENMTPQLEAYLQYIDQLVDNTLRSILGYTDKNGFFINLPLDGSNDIIDIQNRRLSLRSDFEINMRADNCVIGSYRSDTAENDEKIQKAEEKLLESIYTKFGRPISTDHDFTTDYLISNKELLDDGTILELDGSVGVDLLDTGTFNGFNQNNPDSRVIFVPRETFT